MPKNNIKNRIPAQLQARLAPLIEKFSEMDTKPLYYWIVERMDEALPGEFQSIAVVAASEREARQILPVDDSGKTVGWTADLKPLVFKVTAFGKADPSLTAGTVLLGNQIG